MFNEFRLAASFFTLIPISPEKNFSEQDFGRSIKFITLIGVFFGIVNLFCLYLHQFHESKFITALLIVCGNLFLNGGLHLDGLMDSFDGIAASKNTREETLAVIKDSRVGAFGSMAGTLLITSKIIFISEINFESDWIFYSLIFFLVPLASRFMMVLAILFQVDLDDDNSSLSVFKKHQKTTIDFFTNLLGMKIPVGIFLLIFPVAFSKLIKIDFFVIPWMFLAWFVYVWLKFKLKGHNGDTMGAGLEINESFLYSFFVFC